MLAASLAPSDHHWLQKKMFDASKCPENNARYVHLLCTVFGSYGLVSCVSMRGRSSEHRFVIERHDVTGASVVGHTTTIPTVKPFTLLSENQGLQEVTQHHCFYDFYYVFDLYQ